LRLFRGPCLTRECGLSTDCTGFIDSDIDILIYLLTAIGLTPGGSSTVHIYTQTIHRTTQLTTLVGRLLGFEPRVMKLKLTMNGPRKNYRLIWKSAGRAPSSRVIPWNLPYN
jgi:hypothetical protein